MLYVGWIGWDGWLSYVIGLLRAPSMLIRIYGPLSQNKTHPGDIYSL